MSRLSRVRLGNGHSVLERRSDKEQLARDSRLQRRRRDFVSASGVGTSTEQDSTTAKRLGAVPEWEQPKSWETGKAEAGAEKHVLDEGSGPEAQQI